MAKKNTYSVYMEGYVCTGGRGSAHYVGEGEGTTFAQAAKDACIKAYGIEETKKFFSVRGGVPAWWGCDMYDNYADAARAFG